MKKSTVILLVALLGLQASVLAQSTNKQTEPNSPTLSITRSEPVHADGPNQAPTAGFVVVFISQPFGAEYKFWVRVAPSKNITDDHILGGGRLLGESAATVTIPVGKGDFWDIKRSGAPNGEMHTKIRFIPLGG